MELAARLAEWDSRGRSRRNPAGDGALPVEGEKVVKRKKDSEVKSTLSLTLFQPHFSRPTPTRPVHHAGGSHEGHRGVQHAK